jgi:exodeoxyribonuclease-3
MRIATWNVNSVNARLDRVLEWFESAAPDVAVLQEIKCVDEKFPTEAFERLGYNVAVHGQKTYNGVAMLSKHPMEDITRGLSFLHDDEVDEQSRYIEAVIAAPTPFRMVGIYLPNGNPVDTEKFDYKLAWMRRLHAHASGLLELEEPLVIAGDYNVIPEVEDVANPEAWVNDALFRLESRGAFRALKNLGFTDAYMQADGAPGGYTFWDYQAGAWPRNLGIRIDHLLLSPQAADKLAGVVIHRDERDKEKPSDHVPVVAELSL